MQKRPPLGTESNINVYLLLENKTAILYVDTACMKKGTSIFGMLLFDKVVQQTKWLFWFIVTKILVLH